MIGILLTLWKLLGVVFSQLPPEKQPTWQVARALLGVPWHWLVIPFLVLTLFAFLEGLYRSQKKIVAALESSLALEQEKNRKPDLCGVIQTLDCKLIPTLLGDGLTWAGCEIVVPLAFANRNPAPAPIKDFALSLTIGGEIVTDIPAVIGKEPFALTLERAPETLTNLASCIRSCAEQGQPFDGYLYFILPPREFFDSTVEITINDLLIRDYFGGRHKISPQDDRAIYVSQWAFHNRELWNEMEAAERIQQSSELVLE